MSHRFDYEFRDGHYAVFDRIGVAGSSRALARCSEVWVAEFIVGCLRQRTEALTDLQRLGQEYDAAPKEQVHTEQEV